jgi:uncharacterized OB-fold protein
MRRSHYRLVGGRCTSCGLTFFPYSPRCPRCGSRSVEEYSLPREARVEHHTILYQVPEYMREEAPLAFAIIRLPDGTRVAAALTEAEQGVEPGARVEAVLRRVVVDGETGMIAYGVKWRPARLHSGGAHRAS